MSLLDWLTGNNDVRAELEKIRVALGGIRTTLNTIIAKEDKMAGELENPQREVQETKEKVEALIGAMTGVRDELVLVRQQLADAIAANDPAKIQAAATALDEIQSTIDAALPAPPAEPPPA